MTENLRPSTTKSVLTRSIDSLHGVSPFLPRPKPHLGARTVERTPTQAPEATQQKTPQPETVTSVRARIRTIFGH